MKNRDETAQPSKISIDRNNDRFVPWQFEIDSFVSPGLTKLETAAIAAMQWLCSACESNGEWSHDAKTVAETAVQYANALFDELEKSHE